LHEIK